MGSSQQYRIRKPAPFPAHWFPWSNPATRYFPVVINIIIILVIGYQQPLKGKRKNDKFVFVNNIMTILFINSIIKLIIFLFSMNIKIKQVILIGCYLVNTQNTFCRRGSLRQDMQELLKYQFSFAEFVMCSSQSWTLFPRDCKSQKRLFSKFTTLRFGFFCQGICKKGLLNVRSLFFGTCQSFKRQFTRKVLFYNYCHFANFSGDLEYFENDYGTDCYQLL